MFAILPGLVLTKSFLDSAVLMSRPEYVVSLYSVCMLQESTLPLDATCNPVHAWRFNNANTIFQVSSSLIPLLTA